MKIRDIMTSEGLATATLDTTLAEIAVKMRDASMSAIPILDQDDGLAGIVTARDIVVRAIAAGRDPNECTAEEIIGGQIHTIHPDAEIAEAAELMANRQVRRLPVVEDQVIVGLISLDDLAERAAEEAAGAVEDISRGARRPVSPGAKRPQPVSRSRRSEAKQTRVSGSVRQKAASRSPQEQGKKKVTPIRGGSRAKRRAS